MLEIMSPSAKNEHTSHIIALLVEVFAQEMNVNVYGVGSTTFRREDLERGFEPDACFYVQNEEHVRGKPRIGLNVDPPPDLVIEVDITSPPLDKPPTYAQIGVSEVWHCDGERLTIFELGGEAYAQISRSVALPPLTGEILSGFVKESAALESAAWLREVRERAQAAKPG